MNREEILKILNECKDIKSFLDSLESKNIKISDKTSEGETLLHIILNEDLGYKGSEIVKALMLGEKIDINAVDKHGRTCFDILIQSQTCYKSELGTLLLQSGLQLNRENQSLNGPLHTLIQYTPAFWQQLVEIILDLKPLPNVLNANGESYLDLLIKRKVLRWGDIAIRLLKMGMDSTSTNTNKEDFLGQIIEANLLGWENVAKEILKLKIDPNHLNKKGESYLDLLLKHTPYGWQGITIKLIQMGAKVRQNEYISKLIIERPLQWEKIFTEVLVQEYQTQTNAELKNYLNLLLASESSSIEMVGAVIKIMEERKIDTIPILLETISSKNGHERTFIDRCFIDLLKLCIKHGGNIYACDSSGNLCLSSLFVFNDERYSLTCYRKNIVKQLFQEIEFDLSKKIEGVSVLRRLNIPNIHNDAIVDIIGNIVSRCCVESRKEFFDLCANNHSFLHPLIQATLSEDFETMDPVFLQYEDAYIYRNKTSGTNESALSFDCKMLAHRFSLNGVVPIPAEVKSEKEKLLTLTGSNHLNTTVELCQSLYHFLEEFHQEMPKSYLQIFQKTYHIARKSLRTLLMFDDYRSEKLRPKALEILLKDCKNDVAMIHTGYFLHAVCITIVKGTILYRSNKGGCNFGNDVVEQYRITKPEGLTTELLEKLMKKSSSEDNKSYIHRDIHRILGLELVDVIKGKLQTVGNCSWASKKAGVRAVLHYLVNDLVVTSKEQKKLKEVNEIEREGLRSPLSSERGEQAFLKSNDLCREESLDSQSRVLQKTLNQMFKTWTHFDRRFYFKRFTSKYLNCPTLSFILRRILCTHYEATKEKDLILGKTIIDVLKQLPNYVEGYIEFLITHWQLGTKKTLEKQKQFEEFLAALGINLTSFDIDPPLVVQLFAAVIKNDVKKVDEILRTGIKPEACEYLGWTPLHIAVANSHEELVKILSDFQPKWANTKNSVHRPPLFYVKEISIAKRLLQLEANINETVDYDDTPLNTAASQGNLPLVEFFIANGAKTNCESLHSAARSGCVKTGISLIKVDPKLITSIDYDYYLPIHTAAELGHKEFVDLLLQHGSPASAPDVNGNTPLHLAARYDKEPIIRMLADLPTCQLAAKNHQNRTLMAFSLHNSEKKWQHEITRAIKEQDHACVHYDTVFTRDVRMSLLKTPEQTLFGAVRVGDIKAVRGCLTKFPDLNINAIPDPFQHDVFQEAITRKHNEIFDLLLKIPGINVNSKNGIEERPLHCAVASGNMHALSKLMHHPKIEINAKEDMGYTPLIDAAERGNLEAVQLLLTHPDTDSTLVNSQGKSADEVAKKSYFDVIDIASLIKEHQQKLLKQKAEKSKCASLV